MRIEVNGVGLNCEIAGRGRPLLALHGFTGSSATWAPLAALLGQQARLIALDQLGHGRSDAPTDWERYRMERCAEDLVALLDQLQIERTDLLGYSMGGRVALHLAIAAPDRIGALVLEGASPGLADPAERKARLQSDAALAEAIDRDGVAAFVDRWEQLPLFGSQSALPAEVRACLRAQRLQNCALGLANSLCGLGTGRQEPLWERLASISAPTLLLAGELDLKYRQIAKEMAALIPNARAVVVPNAGHAAHLEQPAAFGELVREFLQSVAPHQAVVEA